MIYFLIPTFNEALNIPKLASELKGYITREDCFFVFSDDGSTDDTRFVIRNYFNSPNIQILEAIKNAGPGIAFNTGFNWILKNHRSSEDIVVTMEADCTSDLDILEEMLTINKLGYELVLASVYAQGGGFDKTSFFRRLLSAVANILLRFIFDVKILTLSSFYRVYSINKLHEIKKNCSELITESGFTCMIEILIKQIKVNSKIIEVPMMLKSHKRQGKSKMKIAKTSFQYMKFLAKQLWLKR